MRMLYSTPIQILTDTSNSSTEENQEKSMFSIVAGYVYIQYLTYSVTTKSPILVVTASYTAFDPG